MIDNGAAKSPSGLPAYIPYCIRTNTTPERRLSTRFFRGVSHGTVKELERASIRMSIGPDLFLTFHVDVVDHDIPLIFGLEHHRELTCSYNEFKNTLPVIRPALVCQSHSMRRNEAQVVIYISNGQSIKYY